MLVRRTSLATVVLLVAGLLAVAAPANASATYWWRFVERPAGFPTSADPALTIASAGATLDIDDTGAFHATVELGAVPEDSTGTAVRIALGQSVDGECVTDWEQTVPTFAPGGPASRDGSTITVRASVGLTDYDLGCGSVSLVSLADGAVLDRLEAPVVDLIIGDDGGVATVIRVSNRAVEAGRWSTVWLRVRYQGGDAEGLQVSGSGAGVVVRDRVHHEALTRGDRVWVPVQVRLLGDRARRVTFRAKPFGGLVHREAVPMTVRIRPAR